MGYTNVNLEKKDGVAILTLNRPEALNSLSQGLVSDFNQAMDEIAADEECRVVLLTGAGRAFSAGGDVKGMGGRSDPAQARIGMQPINNMIKKIRSLEKPVIAAVNGFCVGAGFNVALATDIIISSDEAKFSQIFAQVGLIPDAGGTYFMPRLVGMHKAKELIFTKAMLSAADAEKLGLVNRVVPADQLMNTAMELAGELAQGPTRAYGLAKSMINQSLESDLDAMLEYEACAQAIAMMTEDHVEGVTAFKEKRKPQFKGK
ncbi:MAG: enoyl-CoA hydratase/isomerase family protein [Bacillota bacterium]